MARYENALTTLQVRTILHAVNMVSVELNSRKVIEKESIAIVHFLSEKFPADFPIVLHKRMMACTLSAVGKKAVYDGTLSVADYIGMIASAKEENETIINDFGAFGDLYEILIRCALVRVKNFLKATALYVKPRGECDVISKKYGRLEIGHNGKTLSNGTLFDFMEGDYDGMVYGVFSPDDKKVIYDYCQSGEFGKAMQFACENSVLWLNKYDFQNDMDNLTRGQGIAKKGGDIQVVFNSGKYDAFINAIEEGKFTSLSDILAE